MKIPFYENFQKAQSARDQLFLIYIYISIIVIISYTFIFACLNYTQAAIYVSIALIPMLIALLLFEKKVPTLAKTLGFFTSISVVLLQTTYVFSAGTGFQFQFFVLLVVLYLISDLMIFKQRVFVLVISTLIIMSFFYCQNVSNATPLIQLSPTLTLKFFNGSLLLTMSALLLLLHLYSKQLSKMETKLHFMAKHDALTGILNRGSFNSYGETFFSHLKTTNQDMSVIIMDIDNFKNINDTYGHHVGDFVLKELAIEIKSLLRKSDIFARYGGEEFTIILPLTTKEDAYLLAEKIRLHLANLILSCNSIDIQFTVSIGVAGLIRGNDTFDALMIRSDQALYHSKNVGKNCTTLYSPGINPNN